MLTNISVLIISSVDIVNNSMHLNCASVKTGVYVYEMGEKITYKTSITLQ